MDRPNTIEISMPELLRFIRRKLWVVIAVALICFIGCALVCRFALTPQYTASTRIYVLNRSSESAGIDYSDFQAANQLRKDYEVLITGKNVTSEVIQEIGLHMTDAGLASKITVSSPNDTRVLQINVTDENPKMAALIANKVREAAQRQIVEIMAIDAVNLVYEASVPTVPSSPHVTRNVVIATALGTLISLVVLVAFFLADDRIKTEEDVERYLNLSAIGMIPMSETLQKRVVHVANKRRSKNANRQKQDRR